MIPSLASSQDANIGALGQAALLSAAATVASEFSGVGGSTLPTASAVHVLTKGMSFPNGKAALYAVQDYALQHHKQVRVGSRGGKHRKIVCCSDDCPFFVQIYQRHSKADTTWYVSSFELTHSATCTSTAKPTKRQIVEMASFQNALTQAPQASVASLATFVEDQSRVPLRMNLRMVYRAKEAVRNSMVDTQAQSFRRIPALLRQFMALNDGSFARHDVDEDGCFVRAFVVNGVFIKAAIHNQQVYGFECLPASGIFPGVHMYLLGKDGDRKTMVIAGAVCPRAGQEDLTWFFNCVRDAGVALCSRPIISALHAQLRGIEAQFAFTSQVCTKNLIEEELSKMTAFNQHHHALVWGLQSSETTEEYNNRLQWIATACGQEVATFLNNQVPYERWVVAGNGSQRALYGWTSRDFSDSQGISAASDKAVSDQLRDQQQLQPFEFLDQLMVNWVQAAYQRSALYEKWAQSHLQVTPGAQEVYDREIQRIGEFTVARSSASVAFVSPVNNNNTPTSTPRCRVDLGANTCTCAFMQQHAIPCRHMIAVVLFSGQMDSITRRFASTYHVGTYGVAYHGKVVELPLQTDLSESDTCVPPRKFNKRPRANKNPLPILATTEQDAAAASALLTGQPVPMISDLFALDQEQPPPPPANNVVASSRSKRPRPVNSAVSDGAVVEGAARSHRCSKCKCLGHNMRSCPTNVTSST